MPGDCPHCLEGDRPCPCPDPSCRYFLPNGQCLWSVLEENPDGMSLEQIGAVFKISREAIQKIQDKALEKFRRGLIKIDPFAGAIDPWGR